MLHIILLILKVVGMAILVILGLLLLILLTVLFIPIRYRVVAEHGEKVIVDGRVSWLLNFINARFSYLEGIFHMRIRVLGFVLFDNLKPKRPKIKKAKRKASVKKTKRKKSRTKVKSKRSGKSKEIRKSVTKTEERIVIEKDANLVEVTKTEEKEKNIDQKDINIDSCENVDSSIHEVFPEEEKKTIFHRIFYKIRSIKDRIVAFFKGIKSKIVRWYETALSIKNKGGLISDFIRNELNKEGFKITFESLKKLIKHMLPTKLRSRIVFGTGDPCSTGQAMGVMGFLYSFYGDKVQIIPDFENKIFEGKHYARGRIRLVTILIIVIKLILDKRFKQLKSNFQILKEAL